MPSIRDIVYRAGLVRPDVYPEEAKAHWLLELDGKLKGEVILTHKLTPGRKCTGKAVLCPECMSNEGLEYNKHLDMSRCKCGWDNSPKIPAHYPDGMDMELLVKAPYDNLYDLYIAAQVDLYNRENDNYNDSVTLYERARHEWQRKYHQTHLPVSIEEREDWAKVVV